MVALIGRLQCQPKVLVSGSAVGYYGERGDAALDESAGAQDIFLSELCRRWEDAAARAAAMGVRVCRLRTGLVLGGDGGALPPLALATRLGGGAVLGSGGQFVSWIHRDDLVRLILFALDAPALSGPLNGTAPFPATQREFMSVLGQTLGRRIRLRAPARLLRAVLGEFADLFLASQRARPAAALAAGFQFRFAHLDAALADLYRTKPVVAAADSPVTVFVNDTCPVCRTEMAHYEAAAVANASALDFRAISGHAHGLADFGLSESDIRRRLFTIDRSGRLKGGIDAFIAIWRERPQWRWAARLAAAPGLHGLASAVYDVALVPALASWNRRRERSR